MCKIRKLLTATRVLCLGLAAILMKSAPVKADGIYMNGIGARAMSMGGADVAYASDPLGAMGANPAGLGFLTSPGADLGFVGGIVDGTFTKAPTSDGHLDSSPRGLPNGAFALPLCPKVTLGVSFAPVSALDANWTYYDPPGGANGKTTYGLRTDHSEILLLRSAAGLGVELTPQLSLGVSFGLDYNKNMLQAPYIFQAQPSLKGAKTLLDLRTDGYGFDGQIGLLYRPLTNVQLGLTYQSETQVNSFGTASGDAGAQFKTSSLPFSYDAKVRNIFPQEAIGGVSWGFHPKWRLALQLDWIDWHSAFKQLPVTLSDGTSAAVNGVVGSSSLVDSVPLNWENEFVYRGGLEYEVIHNLFLRTGYCYGASPVPDSTLTPLTAAIMENTFTAGVGYHWGRYQVDLAYQYDIPITRNVGTSGLLSGEYSNSSISVNAHWLALTIGASF